MDRISPQLLDGRHPGVAQIARYFTGGHLAEPMRSISSLCAGLAEDMIETLPDSAELTVGLRKLLEAKDCFVRASLGVEGGRAEDLAST